MRKVIFSCLLLLGGLVCPGQESWRGWENAVDLSVMDGFDQQLSPVSIDVEVTRGYRFNKLFVEPSVGCDFSLWEKSFFVNIGYQYFYYEYLYERTPHTALSSGYMAAKWSGGLVLHLGYNF